MPKKPSQTLFDFFNYKKFKDIIQTQEQWDKVVKTLSKVDTFSLDTETTSLKRKILECVVISLGWREGNKYKGVAIPFDFNVDVQHPFLRISEIYPKLSKLLYSKKVIFHNAQYDFHVLEKHTFKIKKIDFDDTMLMSYVTDAESSHGLKDLMKIHFDEHTTKFKDIVAKRFIKDVPYPDICKYAVADAVNTLKLYHKLKKELYSQPDLVKVYEKIDKPEVHALIEMEREGIKIDIKKLNEIEKQVAADIVITEKICKRHLKVNRAFNLDSGKQLGVQIYDVLGYKCPAYTDKGAPKTDIKTLKKLVKKNKGIAELMKYKGLRKLYNDFVLGIIEQLDKTKDGKIYGGYNGTGTRTGRLSSSQPNLQNIPILDKYGFRSIFIPDKGKLMIVADFSQLELRIAALLSGDPKMINAFNKGEDIHQTVADMCGASRTEAKKISFGVLYGMGAETLIEQIFQATGTVISSSTAYEYIGRFKNRFKSVFRFMNDSIVNARHKGYTETLFKRRRPLVNILSGDGFLRSADERKAFNTPIQGTGGDMTKLAQVAFIKERNKHKFDAQMLMQVHDEIVVQADKKQAKEVLKVLLYCMENVIKTKLPVRFLAEGTIAKNWMEGKG